MQVAYGWMPDTVWGTSPLWQVSLDNNQTLKNANYNYLITNYLGTPQLAVNSRGQQTWKGIADAFGNTQLDPDNQITLNLRQPGQYYDQESGLYYNLARHYNPQTGRYIEADPLGVKGGLNLYGYANANPLMYMDPYGLYAWAHFVEDVGNLAGGYGDGANENLTKWMRKKLGWGDPDECSKLYRMAYAFGEKYGIGITDIIPVGKVFKIAKAVKFPKIFKAPKAKKETIPKIGGTQVGFREPRNIDNIKNDMRNGNYRFKSDEGIIAGYVDKNGKYWVSEGHHRMAAAKEIYKETGDASNVKKLLENGLWTKTEYPPANGRKFPKRKKR